METRFSLAYSILCTNSRIRPVSITCRNCPPSLLPISTVFSQAAIRSSSRPARLTKWHRSGISPPGSSATNEGDGARRRTSESHWSAKPVKNFHGKVQPLRQEIHQSYKMAEGPSCRKRAMARKPCEIGYWKSGRDRGFNCCQGQI
jgi:hypothetical protein